MLTLFNALLSAETFKDVEYIYTPDGKDKPKTISGTLTLDSATKRVMFSTKKATMVDLTDTAVGSALYERTSKPRYAAGLLLAWPLLFTKTKKHYLTFQYKTEAGEGKYALFHLDKGNYQRILAATEASLGKKVERSEEH
jgi:hypothetical protein